jgi:amino acid adenylation domain-containing protein
MNLTELLENLAAKNVELWVDGDKLRYRSPENVLTPELLGKIKQYKAEIIQILSQDRGNSPTYPLSHGQKALWFLYQLAPISTAYNAIYAAKLVTNLDIPALKQASQTLIERHPILRTTFTTVDGEPVQTVHEKQQVNFSVQETFDLSQDDVNNWLCETSDRPFDLQQGPILRFNLLINHTTTDTLATKEHILLITLHHIVVDFWSLEIMIGELRVLYEAITTGVAAKLPAQNFQYRDYVKWSEQMLTDADGERLWTYWQQQLSGELPVLNLPTDRPRPEIQTYNGASCFFTFEDKLLQKLTELAKTEGASLYTLILTALQVLLLRYTNQEDILIGSPMVNRSRSEFEKIVGYFTNPVVLRADLSGNPTFQELLGRSRSCVLSALDHQDYPFPLLVERLQPVRDPSFSPLYQVALAWDRSHQSDREVSFMDSDGLIVESMIPGAKGAAFDLTLTVLDVPGSLKGTWNYNTDLFDRSTIERMTGHFLTLVEAIVANPQQHIAQLPILTEFEQQQLLVEWNNTEVEYPQQKCIHQLFEAQVARTPDAIAVVFVDEQSGGSDLSGLPSAARSRSVSDRRRVNQQLTYHELNCRANQLAHYLRSLGVGSDVLVGICAKRSVEMIVGVLGILKAGGAYVPIDPEYPQDRLTFMLEDAAVSVLLTQQHLVDKLPECQAQLVCLDTNWQVISQFSQDNLISDVQANNLGYVIYTSGSTGQPKGVAMNQLGLCNLILWQLQNTTISHGAKTLQFAPISFDVSFQEMFSTWFSGGTLLLIPEELRRDPVALLGVLQEQAVERLFLPFVALQQLAEEAVGNESLTSSNLREIITAGEQLQITPAISNWLSKLTNCTLHNHYGPSESHAITTFSLTNSVNRWPLLPPIGRPIANTQIYILDKYLQPVPIGVPGELHIGGVSLARGYFNRPELTAEKFIKNPFDRSRKVGKQWSKGAEILSNSQFSVPNPQSLIPSPRLYKTGDLARYLPDGNIEYLGRIDNQVKIRGFRIELGEIETLLSQYPHIHSVVVIAREDIPGDKRLAAYIVPQKGQTPAVRDLRQFVKAKLPEYMVPNAFVILESLPLTPSGKVDRRALPKPDSDGERKDKFVAPRTPTEEILAIIWEQVLKVEQVGIDDNFFELGGHSLLATQLISRIRTNFQIELPLRSLFTASTVAQLAQNIQQLQQQDLELTAPPIIATPRNGELPLSFAQTRLWFLDQLEPDNALYNIPAALRLLGTLNRVALEQSLADIIERHEVLRTNFITVDGQPTQLIHSTTPWQLAIVDWQHLPTTEQEISCQQFISIQGQQPFNLATEALVRVTLLVLSQTEHILLVCMHHIISDGWSMGVFLEELARLYNTYAQGQPAGASATLTPLGLMPVQYADFALWQRQWLQGEILQTQLTYWQQQLATAPTFLPLPTDRPRPAVQTFHGAHYSFSLSQELTQGITQLSQQQGVTLFMILLAAFDTFLYRYTGQSDILVGSPIANRNRSEIEVLIGFFVNTLVLRTDLSGNPSFQELLVRVREMSLGAYAHQDLPFEMLVEVLQPERDLSHTPLFQVMFMLQNNPTPQLEMTGLTVSLLALKGAIAKFDLTLAMENTATGLMGVWEYNTDLFDGSTIERMTGHFLTLLEGIVVDSQKPISQLPMLTAVEQQQLLVEWNDTQVDYPQEKCIHQLFEEQVQRTPDAVAVMFENQQLTYHELNCQANQLAHYLRSLGVSADVLVGICVERSLEMVVGLLSILKAGGAYAN